MKIKVKCNNCGTEFYPEIYNEIKDSNCPKDDFISGDLNGVCPKCLKEVEGEFSVCKDKKNADRWDRESSSCFANCTITEVIF